MRHLKTERKLGRNSSHRKAMYRNMVTSLIEHGRITTTLAKAKELRGYTEKTISIGVRLGDLLDKAQDSRSREEQMQYANAIRLASETVCDREILHKLFSDVAPAMRGRPGGYTRIMRKGRRVGDAAEMAIIELVNFQLPQTNAEA